MVTTSAKFDLHVNSRKLFDALELIETYLEDGASNTALVRLQQLIAALRGKQL